MKKRQTLNKWLRKAVHNSGWDKKDTKCFISGRTDDLEAHHSKASFAFIVANSLTELNLPYHKYIDEYNTEELSQIKAEVLKEHREKAVNITLNKEVHKELHRIYGKAPTHEQLLEFKKNYIKSNNKEEVA